MKKLLLSAIVALGLLGTVGTVTAVTAAEVNLGTCMICHGKTFEKAALGKSKIVSDMNATEIATAMVGYKDGTYQSAGMGSLMKGQVSKYTNEELNASVEAILALGKK